MTALFLRSVREREREQLHSPVAIHFCPCRNTSLLLLNLTVPNDKRFPIQSQGRVKVESTSVTGVVGSNLFLHEVNHDGTHDQHHVGVGSHLDVNHGIHGSGGVNDNVFHVTDATELGPGAARPGEFPWMAFLVYNYSEFIGVVGFAKS